MFDAVRPISSAARADSLKPRSAAAAPRKSPTRPSRESNGVAIHCATEGKGLSAYMLSTSETIAHRGFLQTPKPSLVLHTNLCRAQVVARPSLRESSRPQELALHLRPSPMSCDQSLLCVAD